MICSVECKHIDVRWTDLDLQKSHHVLQFHVLVNLYGIGLSEFSAKGELHGARGCWMDVENDLDGREEGKMDCGEAGSGQSIMITFERVVHSHSGAKI